MAFKNEISIEFTAAELAAIDGALSVIETIITGKLISLSPEARTAHARVGDGTESYVAKSYDYMNAHPTWVDPDRINIAEVTKDMGARAAITPRLNRIHAINEAFDDSHLLLGSDIFDADKAFYAIVKGKNDSNVPGAKAVYEDLRQRFPGRPKAAKIPPVVPPKA